MSNKVVVSNDFLSAQTHNDIRSVLCDYGFPWYYNDSVIYGENEVGRHFQFTHVFYMADRPASDYFRVVEPLVQALGVRALIRMKANLVTRTDQVEVHGHHVDLPYEDATTAIYYVNDNDGYTEFEDGTRVESVANRLVKFPTPMRHSGTTCTNQKRRIVINVNYF